MLKADGAAVLTPNGRGRGARALERGGTVVPNAEGVDAPETDPNLKADLTGGALLIAEGAGS